MKTIFFIGLVYLGLGAEMVFPQAPFYEDKTISVVLGGPPGGSARMRTRGGHNSFTQTYSRQPHHHRPIHGGEGGGPPTTFIEGRSWTALPSAAWEPPWWQTRCWV